MKPTPRDDRSGPRCHDEAVQHLQPAQASRRLPRHMAAEYSVGMMLEQQTKQRELLNQLWDLHHLCHLDCKNFNKLFTFHSENDIIFLN